MEIPIEKLDLIESKIDELNERIGEGDDLTQWESVLLDTLEWIMFDGDEPNFFY